MALPLEGVAQYAPIIVLLPLISFLLISFVTQKKGPVSAVIAICSLAGAFLLSLGMAIPRFQHHAEVYEWNHPWLTVGFSESTRSSIYVGLLVDNLSVLTSLMVTFVATLVAIYSYGYMTKEISHFPTQNSASLSRFFAYLSLFVFSMLGLVFSNNLLQIYIFWELVGVCSYLLIGFWYFKKSAADANKKSFVVTKFADLFFLIGILAVGLGAGTFNLFELDQLSGLPFSLMGTAAIPLILITFGPIGKSAQFPLHVWLPDAMEGPTPVSALIHAATMVAAGIYLVGRLFGLYQQAPAAAYFVALIGSLTALMAALIALAQNDIKKVLAYSTISQLGFMLAALGSGAYTAGLFHLFTHAFFKALLFLGSGAVIVACHNNDIWKMGGLKKHLPYTHFAFGIGCLALAGVPPFAGFWSKDEILGGVYHDHPELFIVLAIAAFLTAFYVTRMYCIAFLGGYRTKDAGGPYQGLVPGPDLPAPMSPSKDTLGMEPEWTEEKATPGQDPDICLGYKQEHVAHHSGPPHEVSKTMYVPLLILSFFAAFLGFAGMPWNNQFHHLIQHLREAPHEFSGGLMAASVVIALSGIWMGWSLYAKDPVAGEEKLRKMLGGFHTVLCQKFYMDHFWAWAVSKTMMLWSIAAAWFDDDMIDGGVRGSGLMTALLGEKLRKEHSGLVSHYLFMLIASLLLLTALLASVQPEFVLSPSRILEFKDTVPPGGLLP
ncbi:MAG: NADH-quinone oxidoreductase subunit L [Candidatus Eremiobacteraeota bacterium]|nr:NADH-quinone oxidoreductase subunit L [Candidatus Eremiobacteraeota bacterium]